MKSSWDHFIAVVDDGVDRVSLLLNGFSRPAFAVLAVGASLCLSVLFFSPRLCVLQAPSPNSYEWDRATTYLAQCAHPFAPAAEPVMRWRILPPLATHVLNLPGYWPLVVPWAGLILLLFYFVLGVERLTSSRSVAALSVALLGTSGAMLFITMCHGINDGWFLLGLLVVACSRRDLSVAIACLLAPWVDERFLLGLPLAFFCRAVVLQLSFTGGWRSIRWIGLAISVYPVVRIAISLAYSDLGSVSFVRQALAISPKYLPFAHSGWWMGFRGGWMLIILVFWYVLVTHGRRAFLLGAATTLAGWGTVTLLAADLTRSTNLLLPLFFAGAWATVRSFGTRTASRLVLALLSINLATPFEMVIYNKSLLLHSLPFELLRLYKNWR